jgi:hypothetical protein
MSRSTLNTTATIKLINDVTGNGNEMRASHCVAHQSATISNAMYTVAVCQLDREPWNLFSLNFNLEVAHDVDPVMYNTHTYNVEIKPLFAPNTDISGHGQVGCFYSSTGWGNFEVSEGLTASRQKSNILPFSC